MPLWCISRTYVKNWETIPAALLISRQRGEGDIILTDRKKQIRRKLPKEILGLLAVTSLIAVFLFQTLVLAGGSLCEHYLYAKDIRLEEMQYAQIDAWVFNLSMFISVVFFVILFLFLLGERLSYIGEILSGIDALQNGKEDYSVPLEGSNELTQLAKAVNFLSHTQREIKVKEQVLNEEKDQFIRAMSHDIRTPLTSIIAYSELLATDNTLKSDEQYRYLALIRHKATQIRDMTDILLDGSKRNLEFFEDARLLIRQLVGEFEEILEDDFKVETDINCPAFSGTFDVQELRRIFDNLSSNIQKYANPADAVQIRISLENSQLLIQQENTVLKLNDSGEGYQIGLRSIQRIAQNYKGRMDVRRNDMDFSITVTLSEI